MLVSTHASSREGSPDHARAERNNIALETGVPRTSSTIQDLSDAKSSRPCGRHSASAFGWFFVGATAFDPAFHVGLRPPTQSKQDSSLSIWCSLCRAVSKQRTARQKGDSADADQANSRSP